MKRALCVIVLSVGCVNLEDPTPSTRPQLVVHAVLNPNSIDQPLLVYQARTGVAISSLGGISDDDPVLTAQVTVTAPDGTIMVAGNSPPNCGCPPGAYVLVPSRFGVAIAPGGTYRLQVRTGFADDVSGTTTIPLGPATPTVLPIQVFSRNTDTLRLNWPRVPGARSYELDIAVDGSTIYTTFSDTAVVIPGNALTIQGDQVFPATRLEMVVSAVDANYYDYYRAQSDPFAGAAPSHLTGAVGVFGSVVPILTAQLQVR